MKTNNLLIFSLPVVFFLGFLAGSCWQAMMARPVGPSGKPSLRTEAADVVKTTEQTEDDNLSQAMEDPDFKKVHDFLVRENPMQMNLETPKRPETEKPTPLSERPPVSFSTAN